MESEIRQDDEVQGVRPACPACGMAMIKVEKDVSIGQVVKVKVWVCLAQKTKACV